MDATNIQSVLQAGKIGDVPFPMWLEHAGRVIDEGDFARIARGLAEQGVVSLRWEAGKEKVEEQRLWQTYLVVTLPVSSISRSFYPGSSVSRIHTVPAAISQESLSSPPALDLIHTIAVELCKAHFYCVKGQELWIEYLAARPGDTAAIEMALEAGNIGEMPFPKWLQYAYSRLTVTGIANSLAAQGVASVRWEQSETEQIWFQHTRWQAYLVITLPLSSLSSPPTLPSYELVTRLAMTVCSLNNHFLRVTETEVELWVLFSVDLPLDDQAAKLLKV